MNDFLFLVPIALILGFIGLLAFIWSLKTSQYDDMDGAAERILFEEEDKPAQACSTQRGDERRKEAAIDLRLVPRND